MLDTSVLVAGLRSKRGASFQILRAIRAGDIRIALSVALVLEYESVLSRPGLIPAFTHQELARILDGLCLLAHHQQVFFAWDRFCPILTTISSSKSRLPRQQHLSSPTTPVIFAARTQWEFAPSPQPQPSI